MAAEAVTPLTLKLIQVGFLVLLWLMVLSVAAVMRGDLYARRRTKAPKAAKAAKVARPVASAGVGAASGTPSTAQSQAGALTAAGMGAAAGPASSSSSAAAAAAAARPSKAAKPRRGAARTLRITAGVREGTTIELGASPITIGRLPENTVVLEDDYVSGRHARLYPHEGAWVAVSYTHLTLPTNREV